MNFTLKRALLASALIVPMMLTACASGGGGGGGTTMSPPPPPPPASPPPPPPPPGFNIGAPAPGSFGTSPPTTTAGGLQFASAGGANFSGNGPGPAPGVVFAANQTALKIGSTSIAADTAANAQSFTATVIDPGTADVQLKIPSLGIDQAINVDDPNGDIKLSNGQYLRLQSFNTNPLIEWALIGEWRIDGAANANPAEIGTYVVGYQTPTASVPRAGTASYVDPFGVDAEAFYPRANGALPYTQVFISGGVNLQVNFVNGSVTGAFNNLQAFASTGVAPWNVVTVSGTISGNGISGTTTSANPPANNLAFGSGTGSIKGGFYGPAADEVAGTWTLSDGTNSAIGVFGSPTGTGSPVILPATIGAPEKATVGTTLPTTAGAGLELAAPGGPEFTDAFGGPLAIPVGTTFALTESTLKLTKTAVAADTATDAAGATVTSTEIGLSQSELKIPNLNVDATTRFTPSAATLPDGRVVSITSHATLDYVQLGEWSVGATAANPTSELGDFVLGYQTPLGSMPTVGSATYSRVGGVVGDIVTPPSAAQFGNAPYQSTGVQGDVSLTANFAAGTVTGAFTDMNEGGGVPISALAFNDIGVSATISGDAFSGTTKVTSTPLNTVGFGSNATGTIAGGFYGPQANDIGAVWTLYDGQNALIGTVGASMTSESGLPGGPLSAPCCGPSPAPGLAAFTYVNTGSVPIGMRPPFDNTLLPFTQETLSGPSDPQTIAPAVTLDFVHTDPATGSPTLTLEAPGALVSLSDKGPGPTTDADPAELYQGTPLNGPTYDLTLRHLNYMVFGLWSDPSVTGAWIGGYVTPGAAIPAGTATYAGHTYGVVDVKGSGATVQAALKGDAALNVSFTAGTITGALSNMTETVSGGSAQPWNAVSITGTLSGDSFNGTTAATSSPAGTMSLASNAAGQISGGFFGPNAQELGAAWSLSDGAGRAVGSIGATEATTSSTSDGTITVSTGGTVTVHNGVGITVNVVASDGGPDFTGVNQGALAKGAAPPTDATQFPLVQKGVSGPGAVQLAVPTAMLTVNHVDPATGLASLTLNVGGATIALTNVGAGDLTDAVPAEVYSGSSGGNAFQLSFRHLNYLAFGSWNEPGLTSEWIGGYQTPAGAMPTAGTATYAGATYGVVDTAVSGGTQEAALKGAAHLDVDFGSGVIVGGLNNMTATVSGGTAQPWDNVSINATLSGASLSGTTSVQFAPTGNASLTSSATGTITGGFYGPHAEELGATWSLGDGTGRAVGAIGATKQ